MEARIALSYESDKEAQAVVQAVSPDNVKVPKGLFIKTTRRGFKAYTLVRGETKLQTFVATLDDLLSCVSIAEKTFSAVKKLELRG